MHFSDRGIAIFITVAFYFDVVYVTLSSLMSAFERVLTSSSSLILEVWEVLFLFAFDTTILDISRMPCVDLPPTCLDVEPLLRGCVAVLSDL